MEEIKIDPDSYTPLYEQIRLKINGANSTRELG